MEIVMKNTVFTFLILFVLLLSSSLNGFADDSGCKDLDGLITSMDKLNDALDKIKAKDIDDELDKTLKDVAVSLVELSKSIPSLEKSAANLKKAYDAENLAAYQDSLDECAEILNTYYNKHCTK